MTYSITYINFSTYKKRVPEGTLFANSLIR